MGQTVRTTKLLLDLSERVQGGANRDKRRYLVETVKILDTVRQFYLDFFLAHPEKVMERVEVESPQSGEVSERLISADKLLTWAEFHTVATAEHPDPLPDKYTRSKWWGSCWSRGGTFQPACARRQHLKS